MHVYYIYICICVVQLYNRWARIIPWWQLMRFCSIFFSISCYKEYQKNTYQRSSSSISTTSLACGPLPVKVVSKGLVMFSSGFSILNMKKTSSGHLSSWEGGKNTTPKIFRIKYFRGWDFLQHMPEYISHLLDDAVESQSQRSQLDVRSSKSPRLDRKLIWDFLFFLEMVGLEPSFIWYIHIYDYIKETNVIPK